MFYKAEYPRIDNHCFVKKVEGDSVTFVNANAGCEIDVDYEYAKFAVKLNGKRNPYKIKSPLTADERRSFIRGCTPDLFRKKKTLEEKGGIFLTLFIPRVDKKFREIGKRFSKSVDILWLPLLLAGLIFGMKFNFEITLSAWISGFVCGFISALFAHELSHGFRCVSSPGGRLFEFGVFLSVLRGGAGAYASIEYGNVSERDRLRILLAGVKANFLLAGTALILKTFIFPCFFFAFAALNLVVGAVNILPVPGLDGGCALSVWLTGSDELLFERAEKIVRDKSTRKRTPLFKTVGAYAVCGFKYIPGLIFIFEIITVIYDTMI